MKIQTALLLTVATSVGIAAAPRAHAFPNLAKLVKAPAPTEVKAPSSVTCPDLSGHWIGTCRSPSGDSSADQTTIIQSSCSAITMDQEDSSPGSLQTHTNALPDATTVLVEDTHWSADYSSLQFNAFIALRVAGMSIAQSAVSASLTAEMKLSGAQLLLTYQVLGETGQCVYDKAQSR